jgi:hypothetical protein
VDDHDAAVLGDLERVGEVLWSQAEVMAEP